MGRKIRRVVELNEPAECSECGADTKRVCSRCGRVTREECDNDHGVYDTQHPKQQPPRCIGKWA